MPPVKEPLAGLALLVIFGLLIWYDRPVQSSRPFDSYAQQQDLPIRGNAYESWLWQDPFGFKPDEKENPTVPCALNAQVTLSYKPDEKKPIIPCRCQLSTKIRHIKNEEKKDAKILAPLLKVRSETVDIENKELRIRSRYAVIAGLIESGYRPQENYLHFCSAQKNKEYDVRWEHFRYEPEVPPDADTSSKNKTDQSGKDASNDKSNHKPENKPDIIVVWMNSEIFTDDVKFDQMLGSLFKSEEISEVNFSIYDLNNVLDQKRSTWITEKINHINDKSCKNKGIELKDTQTDDEALIKKLTKELELRNIKNPSDVMIITEQDSGNVRNLSHNFRESLCKSSGENPVHKQNEQPIVSDACEIKNVFYLKGLDAYQQKLKQDKNEDQANKAASRLSKIGLSTPPSLPIGPGQFDYFHRLAEQIKNSHKDINLEKRDSGIKAVGVFGNDFHDKLLIFEALRAEMPNILIFTTDLDAQMLHPQHWLSTRNLIVASHFDLLLKDSEKDNKEYQKQSSQLQPAPFRDSQQTSIFFRTLNIVANDITTPENDIKTPKTPSPQIFEVGRNGFHLLEENVNLNNQPPSTVPDQILPLGSLDQMAPWLFFLAQTYLLLLLPQDQAQLQVLLLAGIIFSLIYFGDAIRPHSRKSTRFFLTLALLPIAWFVATTGKSGEPLSFTGGISLWPAIFIQIIAVFLAGAFFLRGRRELDANFDTLTKKYFDGVELSVKRWRAQKRWRAHLKIKSELRVIDILPLFIFTFLIYAINDAYPRWLSFIVCLLLLVILLIIHLRLIHPHNQEFVSIKDWMEKDDRQVSEKELWQDYCQYGLLDHRLARIAAMWLFFAIVETILIYLLPPWPLPCRGHAACHMTSWVNVLSFFAVMLLLFFTLDAVRLSFCWIKKLRKQHPLLAERNTWDVGKEPLATLEKIVSVIAERTSVVDRLIYYPMLCIMLLLFAKITYFDNQEFPLSKGITFAASISLLFFSGFMLRSEANRLKRSVIQVIEKNSKNNETEKRIKDICEGAFQPMYEQPVMQALLIILASISLFAGEYLKFFGK